MYNVSFPGLGIELEVNPVAFTVGSFKVYWYGIIIGIGFMLALIFALKSLKKFGINRDSFIDCVITGLIFGIIGARLYYVAFKWDYYSQHLNELFAIHNGGLAIYGGVIGGLLSACVAAKLKKVPIPAMLDIGVMGFLIGQGLGRWGNFFNQEAFGTPTDLPWRMASENTDGIGVHPCFLYESLWCLLGFFLLWFFSRKFRKYDGQIFLMYLVWYGAERMIVEGLRTDSLYTPLFGLRVSQILAALTMTAGIVLLIVFRKRTYKAVNAAADGGSAAVSADEEKSVEKNISQTEETVQETGESQGSEEKSGLCSAEEETPVQEQKKE